VNIDIFSAIGDLAISSRRRVEVEHSDFLVFYRQLVETMPTEMVEIFGTLDGIRVRLRRGKVEDYGIELTATDFMWWKSLIEADHARFVSGPADVKRRMLERFATGAEAERLTPDERKKLLFLLDSATP
jgi:hypothetical protein